jgi:hypothetical protein
VKHLIDALDSACDRREPKSSGFPRLGPSSAHFSGRISRVALTSNSAFLIHEKAWIRVDSSDLLMSSAKARGEKGKQLPRMLQLPGSSRMDIGVLSIVAVLAFIIPIMGQIAMWVGIALILIFVAYLWRASRVPGEGEPAIRQICRSRGAAESLPERQGACKIVLPAKSVGRRHRASHGTYRSSFSRQNASTKVRHAGPMSQLT